tara:strand:+ start:8840 stop:10420 length:1581 start_codon:yes stop_codon:yes gene_type:complete
MHKETVERSKTGHFTETAIKLVEEQSFFKELINQPFSKENLKKQSEEKLEYFTSEKREMIVNVLQLQLNEFNNGKVNANLDLLKDENTVTITTGHQLNLYSGPLYVIYKIMHVIKLAKEMNEYDSDHNYVPLFWMATEDHDFEEINHFHLFNDTLTWQTDQSGPVGRFTLDEFDATKAELLEKFQNNEEFANYLNHFYTDGSLAESTREFIMDLFSDYGLIILDADDRRLKSSFEPVMRKDIEEQFSIDDVNRNTKVLEGLGMSGQVTPRPINLFYITDQQRDRIIPEGDKFKIGEDSFSKQEVLDLLSNHPERFSPNVVLRPVYQEFILPNMCYVGGGGEMAYWLQLKSVFDTLEIPYPVIQVRNSVQFIDGIALKKMKKLGLTMDDIFNGIHQVKKQFVLDNESESLDFTEIKELKDRLSSSIESVVESVDKGLEGYGKSEVTKLNKQVDGIEQKLIRHQKKKHDDAMNQIDNLFERLFPADGLQERYDNVIPKLVRYGKEELMRGLYQHMDPFENGLILIYED